MKNNKITVYKMSGCKHDSLIKPKKHKAESLTLYTCPMCGNSNFKYKQWNKVKPKT